MKHPGAHVCAAPDSKDSKVEKNKVKKISDESK